MTPDVFNAAAARLPSSTGSSSGKRTRIPFIVYDGPEGAGRHIRPAGRDSWALSSLILAGAEGCTPIDHPGPRWSGYVHKLRHVYGLHIESITEMHGGDFAGKHARYVLHSRVEFADLADAARHGCGQ